MIKQVFYVLLFSLLSTAIHSQLKVLEHTHYLFPEFTKGVVLMKNEEKNEALLNYNSLTEEMIFLKLLRKGKDYGVNLAETYNKIASNFALPLVPPLALEVIKKL